MKNLFYTLGVIIFSMVFSSCQHDELTVEQENSAMLKSTGNCGDCLEKWSDSKVNILALTSEDLYVEAFNDNSNLYLRVYRLNSKFTRVEELVVKQDGEIIYGPYASPVGVGNIQEIIIPAVKINLPWDKCDKLTISLTAKGVGKGGGKVISDLEYTLREIATITTISSSIESPVCIGEKITLTAEVSAAEVLAGGELILLEGRELITTGPANEPLEYTYTAADNSRTFTVIYYGSSGYCTSEEKITIDTKNCSLPVEDNACEENFTYSLNADGSYTFTYVPAEDFVNANVVFTFAQGVTVSGDLNDWSNNGVTRQKTMNLNACETYSWTVTLAPDCKGQTKKSNVWTDFKVVPQDATLEDSAYSKKEDLKNIEMSCN